MYVSLYFVFVPSPPPLPSWLPLPHLQLVPFLLQLVAPSVTLSLHLLMDI